MGKFVNTTWCIILRFLLSIIRGKIKIDDGDDLGLDIIIWVGSIFLQAVNPTSTCENMRMVEQLRAAQETCSVQCCVVLVMLKVTFTWMSKWPWF